MKASERMRIGIDATALSHKGLAGIGFYLYNVLSLLVKKYPEVEFVLYSNNEIQHHIENDGNVFERIVGGNALTQRVGILWLRFYLPRILKQDGIKLFWGPQHLLPRKTKGIRYVLTVNDLALLIHPEWGKRTNALVQNVFARQSIHQADAIIAISESTQKDIMRICRIPSDRIHVVYIADGLSAELLSADNVVDVQRKFGLGNEYILYVGTIEPRKNLVSVIRAFDLAAEKNPNVELVLAGGLGWRYSDILKAIENAKHADRIKRLGYISNVEKVCLYANAKAFAFPSHYEGFGIPVLEALKMDTLVITARNSSLPEVGGDAAIYVENENNIGELCDAFEFALGMKAEERQLWIEKGRVQVCKFSWENCVRETAKVLMRN